MYTTWRFHGESLEGARNTATEYVADKDVTAVLNESVTTDVDENGREGMDENGEAGVDENAEAGADVNVGTSRCYHKKKSAAEQARKPLYPSCPKGKSAMYAAIMVNNIKTQFGISDNGVTAMLELMKELVPEGNTLPSKFPDIKKIIKEMGMDYVTYDACINDCVLYWKDNSSLVKCPVCQEPRLKRLYSIPWISEAMLWHSRAQKDVNIMRHPVDYTAWRCADNFFPEFAKEARNVTLGIAIDGLNPNGCFGFNYSCWPVILCPYNLPPSMCMKREFSMLCLLISGPRASGKDIDVYLQPLIEEFKELWNDGVMTFDSFTKSEFLLKERLLWAIHDFTALGILSGCVTHGYYACPTCGEEKVSEWLSYSKKNMLYGTSKHKYRDDKTNFSGGVEHGKAPWPLTGLQIQEMVKAMRSKQDKGKPPAKKRKRGSEVCHCTYVMHTKNNITEHIINTLMGNSKSKDGVNARKDMEAMGIKKRLMKGIKGLVRNKRYIEGCIARGYALREASLYLMEDISDDGDGTHKHTRQAFLDDDCDDADEKYDVYVNGDKSNGQRSKSFHLWLSNELLKAKETDSTLWRLLQGPLFKAQSYKKYQVNGFTFSKLSSGVKNVSQNSGVSMKVVTRLHANVGDKNACKVDAVSKVVKVNLSKMRSINTVVDESFILASEATQVFYSKDLSEEGWSVVLHSRQRLTSAVDKSEVLISFQSVLTDNENLRKLLITDSIF
ncbi:uncharacterized protein LOC113350752 [Papaver somniferum]|uniref:uncharacterized protein LOC113350752 n=1 Tax=Papaver somniferum TaxID=3469 RepID=UPI000E6F6DED|nr:uncharacterized protein LOC113350752 [Papaver somniferum]